MDGNAILSYTVDHFGNVIILFGLMAGGVKYLWNRIRGEIQTANSSVVNELKGMREDFQKMAVAQSNADDRINRTERQVERLDGTVTTLVTALSGVLVLRDGHKEQA